MPLKLQEVLSSLFPELGEEIEKVNRGDLFRTNKASVDGPGNDADLALAVEDALRAHASRIAESDNTHLLEDDIAAVAAIANARLNEFEDMGEKREAFREVEKYMGDTYGIEIDPEEAQRSREQALSEDSGQGLTARSPELDVVLPAGVDSAVEGYFLDCEFVAIYW